MKHIRKKLIREKMDTYEKPKMRKVKLLRSEMEIGAGNFSGWPACACDCTCMCTCSTCTCGY